MTKRAGVISPFLEHHRLSGHVGSIALELAGFALLACTAFVFAGGVKGLTGLGLPTTAIGLLTLFIEPRVAIAVVLFPMVFTNAWQVWRMGDIAGALRRYIWFAGVLMIGVGVTTMLAAQASDRLIFAVTGMVIILFVAVNFLLSPPKLPDRYDRTAQIVMGTIAGIMGGLTAVWGPPMAIYLSARQVEKDEFVRVTGLLIFLGSLPLVAGYVVAGFLTLPLAVMSGALILPTLAGFALGERIRGNLPQAKFRKVLLYVFLVLGLNLIRRAIWNV
ncbi:MAG: putative membrane protein YfcA [Paracoccaceae bacterium]